MAIQTPNGFPPNGDSSGRGVAADGIPPLGTAPYKSPQAADWNNLLADLQEANRIMQPSGILGGGTCTASSLNVTVPNGTQWFTRTPWTLTADYVASVFDNAVTYLWGCSDGNIRPTSNTTPPSSFDPTTACILTKATAVSGTVTIDNTVQWLARQVNPVARIIIEGNPLVVPYGQLVGAIVGTANPIAQGISATLSQGYTAFVPEPLQVLGHLMVQGHLIVRSL